MAGIFKVLLLVGFVVAICAQDYDGGFGDVEGAGDGEGEFAESSGSESGEFDGGESQSAFDYADASENHETQARPKRSIEARALRVRRGGQGYVGPVYTYVKTDHHGNFKWGARHLVGSKFGHGGGHH